MWFRSKEHPRQDASFGHDHLLFKDQLTGYLTNFHGDVLCLLIYDKVGIEARDGQRFFKYVKQGKFFSRCKR